MLRGIHTVTATVTAATTSTTTIYYYLSLSPFNGHYPSKSGLVGFIGAKYNGGGGDNWNYKTCEAPVKSSPPTNQHPTFYRLYAIPVTQPIVTKH